MKIKYLLLKAFKLFPLRDLEIFEHEFTSRLLLIIGPNGSGKTSLFKELSPLPTEKSKFNKGGYKEIHIEHNKKEYKLVCDFRESVKFNFIVDGDDLNLSGNVTTQKELVFKHFNITESIHDLLVGIVNFTDMSLINRKKLFSSITHINIDKVLDNYNKLKEELKNNEFILKSNTSLLQAEEQKLINKNHLETLLDTQKRTKDFIDFLLEFRTNISKYHFNSDIDKASVVFESVITKLKDIWKKHYVLLTAYPRGNVQQYSTKYQSKLDLVTYQLNSYYTESEKKLQEIKLLSLANLTNSGNLEVRLCEIEESISKLKHDIDYYSELEHSLESIKNDVFKLEVSLPDILNSIPLNIDKEYSKDKYENYINSKNSALEKLNNLITEEISTDKDIEHYSKHNDNVMCPNCDHIWSLKGNVDTLSKLKDKKHSLYNRKIDLQNYIKETDIQINKMLDYFNLYRQYSSIRNSTKQTLVRFWDRVDKEELIFKKPTSILTHLRDLSNDIISIETIRELNKEAEEIKKNLEIIKSLKDKNLSQLESEVDEITVSIIEMQLEKKAILETLSIIDRVEKIYSYINQLQNGLKEATTSLTTTNLSYVVENIIKVIESDLSKYKVVLIETEKEINQYNSIQYTIDRYVKQIEETKTNIKVLNIILEELSPKNGLIAKSVSSFLNIIINNINATIASIWDYKMELSIIDVASDSLNYKFKVKVEDKLDINDISEISNGMKEIVNLSFKMILYKLLGLENYPVWLDEFGVKLDKSHRGKIFDLIFKMLNSNQYSQIFLITHLDMSYSMFRDTEVLEM